MLGIYLRAFAKGRELRGIASFDLRSIEEWFDNRKELPVTKRGNISKLSALFSFAWKRGYIASNPCVRLDRPRIDYHTPKIFTPLQARTLLHYLTKTTKRRWRLAQVTLGLFCGLRPVEMTRMYWSDIDFERKLVRVEAAASKVRARRIVPIPDNAIEWLRLCPKNDLPLGAKQGNWLKSISRHTGLKWSTDVLRHTCASYLIAQFEDVGRVARWLGNSPSVLLSNYVALVSPEDCLAFWAIRP